MDPHSYTFTQTAADHRPRQQSLPPPPPGQWYQPPSQFHYQHPPQHWGPPQPAYPSHGQYPPPHPHLPPPYPPPPQNWSNTNWGHRQGQEYPAHQGGEDWAAKARAWAASKDASENQLPQSQFTPVSRLEEQSPYHDPYKKASDSYYTDAQSFNSPSGYNQYPPPPGAPPQMPSFIHTQEHTTTSSGPTFFLPDECVAYGAKDGRFGGDSSVVYPHLGSMSASPSVHMQEVPSSYSSIAGTVESGDRRDKVYTSFPLPTDSSQVPFHDHLPPPPIGSSVLREQPHYPLGNYAAEPSVDHSDQPLNLTRRFSFDHEPMMQQIYNNDRGGPMRAVDPVATISSNHTWPSHLPGTVYPPFPPVLPCAQQHKHSLSLTTSIPAYSAPYERMSGPNFQTSIPSVGIDATSGINPSTVFPGDVYGVLSDSDRPKKPAVPNWLKEEIIKNKAKIGSSGPERPIDSINDEAFDSTPSRADQEDSKSMDSPRSAVEDEEENVEAARTAEINQEIKRILTEVLLKVTDELFDEIATLVFEEDLTIPVAEDAVASEHKPSFAVPTVSIPKASAKVIFAGKAKEVETDDEIGKSTSNSPGDLLGLASYASDGDDAHNSVQHQPITIITSTDNNAAENDSVQVNDRDSDSQEHGDNNNSKLTSNEATVHRDAIDEHNYEGRKTMDTHDISKPDDSLREKGIETESVKDASKKLSAADDSRRRESRNKQDNKNGDMGETRKSYVERDYAKDGNSGKNIKGGKEDESHRRHGERNVRTEIIDKNSGSKERMKDQGGKSGEKAKEYDSKKRSIDPDGKMDKKEKERDKRADNKDYSDRRREHKKDEKEERSRDKHRSESSRHKRQRSPSVGSRGRSTKGNSLAGHAKYSSDESSDNSKRKLHTKRRNLSRSPSPSRSRKRQDSQSPTSKHSPLSSLENTRGRRSKSRSSAS